MLNATNNLNSVEAMYEFNKFVLNSKDIRDIENIKCAIYYHTTLSHELILLNIKLTMFLMLSKMTIQYEKRTKMKS